MGASSMIVLILAGLAFSIIAILVAKIVTKGTKNAQKSEPYECGIPTIGIGDNCVLKNVIIDKDCRIGNNVKITGGAHLPDGDHALLTVKEGIVVLKKEAVIPDGFVL